MLADVIIMDIRTQIAFLRRSIGQTYNFLQKKMQSKMLQTTFSISPMFFYALQILHFFNFQFPKTLLWILIKFSIEKHFVSAIKYHEIAQLVPKQLHKPHYLALFFFSRETIFFAGIPFDTWIRILFSTYSFNIRCFPGSKSFISHSFWSSITGLDYSRHSCLTFWGKNTF